MGIKDTCYRFLGGSNQNCFDIHDEGDYYEFRVLEHPFEEMRVFYLNKVEVTDEFIEWLVGRKDYRKTTTVEWKKE